MTGAAISDPTRHEVAKTGRRVRLRRRVRTLGTDAVAIVGVVTFVVATVGIWAERTFLDTDVWVRRVAPVVEDEQVQEALGQFVTTELMKAVDPETFFEQALPERGQVLAVPLAGAVEDFARTRVDAFLATEEFEDLWREANERAHAAALRLLRGESDVATADGGEITINLLAVVQRVIERIAEQTPELFGTEIDLTSLNADQGLGASVERLEAALGVSLPEGFGQFVVYDGGRLSAVQDAVNMFDRLVVLAVVLAVVCLIASLWMSRRRRRTFLQILVGLTIGLVLLRRAVFRVDSEVLGLVQVDENRGAVGVVLDAFLDPLLLATVVMLVVIALVALVALVTGPYPWAVHLRARVGGSVRGVRAAMRGEATSDRTVEWIATHREALRIAGAGCAVLVLWTAELSWLGVLVLAILVFVYDLGVRRIGAAPSGTPA